MASIPKAVPGFVFRYDYLRPHEAVEGVEHGKERPTCILVTLKAGERLSGVTVVAEDGSKIVADYEATGNDVVIVRYSRIRLLLTKLASCSILTLSGTSASLGTALVCNCVRGQYRTWPNAGNPGRAGPPRAMGYDRPLPGPKLAEIAKAFRLLREKKLVHALLRHPD